MNTFRSFFMGGYECADHINRSGERVNLLRITEHDKRALQDYEDLASLGILVAREGICWSAVETSPFIFDFSEVENRIKAAENVGIQLIWDLCHFGYPDGIYPTHPHFCRRFEALCTAFGLFYKSVSEQPLYVVPINEISFLSWHSGDVRGTVPFAVNSGFDIKYHLCKAAILGIERLRDVCPECRIILVEPLISIHGSEDADWNHINTINEHQFQAMDIIAGRMCPELGGKESNLDILGFNYYWNSQWEDGAGTLPWPELIPRRTRVSTMLSDAYNRYNRPLFLSETGHFGEGRAEWIEEISKECYVAIQKGIPLLGACIYPVTDRPDWDDLSSYSDCGIFDLDDQNNRIPHLDSINAIRAAQQHIITTSIKEQNLLSFNQV
jgi:beta-glucosidase/6-phospho-beta-glucosidase/beta-galactosidase